MSALPKKLLAKNQPEKGAWPRCSYQSYGLIEIGTWTTLLICGHVMLALATSSKLQQFLIGVCLAIDISVFLYWIQIQCTFPVCSTCQCNFLIVMQRSLWTPRGLSFLHTPKKLTSKLLVVISWHFVQTNLLNETSAALPLSALRHLICRFPPSCVLRRLQAPFLLQLPCIFWRKNTRQMLCESVPKVSNIWRFW